MFDILQKLLTQIAVLPFGIVTFVIFFIAYMPIPFPNEMLFVVLNGYQKDQQLDVLYKLMVPITLGEIAWSSTVFYLVKHHIQKLRLPRSKGSLAPTHWFNKFGMAVFLFTPSVSAVIPYLNDVVTGIVAHRGANFLVFLSYLSAGSVIRTVFGILLVRQVFGI